MSEFDTIEKVKVPEHSTFRMTNASGWTFWRSRDGCIRVRKGDFTAYLLEDEARGLASFIRRTGE